MTQNQNANTRTTRKEIPEILRGKRYLDPSYDPAFYALLDDEEALADFINSLLHLEDGRKIKSMKYTFNQPLILRAPEAKEIKFDIHAWTEDNRCMDIEIQRASHPFFTDRVLLYGAYLTIDGKIKMDKSPEFKALEENERKRRRYQLPEIVSIWLCNFPLRLEPKSFRDTWHLYSDNAVKQGNPVPVFDKKSYILIDLGEFSKIHAKAESREEQWLYLLTHAGKANASIDFADPILQKALERIEIGSASDELLSSQVDSMVTQDEIDARIADGVVTGRQQGIQQGIQQGLDSSLTALDLLSKGTPVATIAKETKLSEDHIRQLQSKMTK